ncbi:MAG: hypothetical protein R3C24_01855 [Cyanobacteriota/Melainabacteria group bacterium]
MTKSSPKKAAPAPDFFADLCKDWEKEAAKAEALGICTVMLRIGGVLSPEGGMLGQALPPSRWGAAVT